MRLFTALEMPEAALEELARVQEALRSRVDFKRWQPLAQAHVTLHFLGEVDEGLMPGVQSACAAAAAKHGPFALSLAGLGAFPSARKPNVLWAGLAGDLLELQALQTDEHLCLAALGLTLEDRRYSPHVTLAREPRGGVEWESLTDGLELSPITWRVERILLFRSELTSRGAIHTPIGEYDLKVR